MAPANPAPAALQRLVVDFVALIGLGIAFAVSLALTGVGTGLAEAVLALVGVADDGWSRAVLRVLGLARGLVANWLIFL